MQAVLVYYTFVKEPQKYAEWAKILAKGPIKHQRQQKYTGKAKQFDEQKQAMELLPVGKNHQRHQNHQQQKENIFPLSPPLLLGQILEFLREGDLKNQPLENPRGQILPQAHRPPMAKIRKTTRKTILPNSFRIFAIVTQIQGKSQNKE